MEEHLTKEERKKLRQEEWKKQLASEEKKKRFGKIGWWVGGIALVAFSIWFIMTVVNTPSTPTTATTLTAPGPKTTDMTFGNPKAKVVLTEYADFQCPGCGAFYPIVKKLTQDYKDKVFFVYRFFPLTNIHRNALQSSEAGYAASKQGKFWEMHDLLFAHQNDWAELSDPTDTFVGYAQQIGLDTTKFKQDMTSSDTEKYIQSQYQSALDIGLPGTPTFFINGKQIRTPNGYDAFKQVIDQQLANSK